MSLTNERLLYLHERKTYIGVLFRRLQLETAGKMLIILDGGIIGNLDSNSQEQSSMTVGVCVPEQASSRRAEFLLLLTWFQALQVSPPVTFPLNRTV